MTLHNNPDRRRFRSTDMQGISSRVKESMRKNTVVVESSGIENDCRIDEAEPENSESIAREAPPQHTESGPALLRGSSCLDGEGWVQVPDDSSVISELETPEFRHVRRKTPSKKRQAKSTKGDRGEIRHTTNRGVSAGSSGPKDTVPHDVYRYQSPTKRGRGTAKSSQTATETDVVAAQNMAKARVRAKKLQERRENETRAKEQERSESTRRRTRLTAEQGHARARARVKLRKLKEKAIALEEDSNRSRSPSKSPQRVTGVRDAARNMGRSRHQDDLVSILSVLSMDPESCRSYLLADENQSVVSLASSKRTLTIPKGPNLALEAKYGDKTAKRIALLQTDDDASDFNSVSSMSTWGTVRSITKPLGPKFLLEAKYGAKHLYTADRQSNLRPSPRRRHHHREETGRGGSISSTSPVRTERKPTVPVAPKFHSVNRRQPPKSTLELQQQEMKKQFRARPMPKFSRTRSVAPTRSRECGGVASYSDPLKTTKPIGGMQTPHNHDTEAEEMYFM